MEVQDINQSWHGHSGSEVEAYIRSGLNNIDTKIGIIYRYDGKKITTDNSGATHEEDACYLLGFKDQSTKELWEAEGHDLNSPYILSMTEIPAYPTGYSLTLLVDDLPQSEFATNDFEIPVYVKSQFVLGTEDNSTAENIDEFVYIIVETSTNSGETWIRRGTIKNIKSNSHEFLSMKGLLPTGKNMFIRLTAVGGFAVSLPKTIVVSVYDLQLSWDTFNNARYRSPDNSQYTFNFNKNGQAEGIHVEISKSGYSQTNDIDLTTQELSLICSIKKEEGNPLWDAYADGGLFLLNAHLYTGTVISNEVVAEFLIGETYSDVAINNKIDTIYNYTPATLFSWNVNAPGTYAFKIYYAGNLLNTLSYVILGDDVWKNHDFSTIILIDNFLNSELTLYIDILKDNSLKRTLSFNIIDLKEYLPTADASFILSPALISNSNIVENSPTILNPVNLESILISYSGFDLLSDGWVNVQYETEILPALKIPAKRSVEIEYNPFIAHLNDLENTGTTIEFDIKCYNILNTEEPLITIVKDIEHTSQNDFYGLIIYPDHASFSAPLIHNVQSVYWAEDEKTHIALTIGKTYINSTLKWFIKLYVNGTLSKEFADTEFGEFISNNSIIKLGNTSSDLDVYGIRVYYNMLSSRDILLDYISGLPTLSDKAAAVERNSIYSGGLISYNDAFSKYNTILHIGKLFNGHDDNDSSLDGIGLDINFVNGDGKSIKLRNLSNKGLGTTAMGYYVWNLQYSFITENDDASKLSYQITYDEQQTEQHTPISKYAITPTEPEAKKLVGKVNFASSMQSHKLGLTWAYTDVYKLMYYDGYFKELPGQIVNNERLAVYQKPFLFFKKEESDIDPVFVGLMTFGAGKGDKPTFGYNSDTKDTFMMIEGSDNGGALTLFNTKWDENITYQKEAFNIGESENFSLDLGELNQEEYLSRISETASQTDPLKRLLEFFNFVYKHTLNVEIYNGRAETLILLVIPDGNSPQFICEDYTSNVGLDNPRTYLYIPDFINKVYKRSDKTLEDEYLEFTGTRLVYNNREQLLNIIKSTRANHFKTEAYKKVTRTIKNKLVTTYLYFNIEDALYHSCFIKLFAATDNRAKNTYYYTDPKSLEIRWLLDDLDTVLKTNNMGLNIKPYWVEENTVLGDGYYWSGLKNAFYTLIDTAFADELKVCMRSMLSAMTKLTADYDSSVLGFMQRYLLSTQYYFPEMAYNETAKCVYEEAYNLGNWGDTPLTLSNGSQKESEYLWLVDRIMYISSWCSYGPFAAGSTASTSIMWRGGMTHTFNVKSAKYLYPAAGSGSSVYVNTEVAVPDNVTVYATKPVEAPSGEEELSIKGVDYYWSVGDFNTARISNQYVETEGFTFNGKRLREIKINESGLSTTNFNAKSIKIEALNIETFIARNVTSITTSIDFSKCFRLEVIDLRGCSNVLRVILPESGQLREIYLPSNLEDLTLINLPNLELLTIDNTNKIKKLIVNNINPNVNVRLMPNVTNVPLNSLLSRIISSSDALNDVVLYNVINLELSETLLRKLFSLGRDKVIITGSIKVSNDIPFDLRLNLFYYRHYIGHDNLVINFTPGTLNLTDILAFSIGTYDTDWNFPYFKGNGPHTLTIVPQDTEEVPAGSLFTNIVWELNPQQAGQFDAKIDEYGSLTINSPLDSETITITATVRTPGGTVQNTAQLIMGDRAADVGDIVYSDGTYIDPQFNNPCKEGTEVGICFYSAASLRLMAPMGNIRLMLETTSNNSRLSVPFGPVQGDLVIKKYYNNACLPDEEDDRTITTQLLLVTKESGSSNYGNEDENYYGYLNKYVPLGLYKTLLFIRLRDSFLALLQSLGKPFKPVADLEGSNYDEYHKILNVLPSPPNTIDARGYFPAVSLCWAYHPDCVPEDHEKFGAHKWWLPTFGEMYTLSYSGVISRIINFIGDEHGLTKDPNPVYFFTVSRETDDGDIGACYRLGSENSEWIGGSLGPYIRSKDDYSTTRVVPICKF